VNNHQGGVHYPAWSRAARRAKWTVRLRPPAHRTCRRRGLGRRAAEALERICAERLPEIAGRLTRHYREAGAAYYAEMAGDRALALAAPVEAAHFYEQALALEPAPSRYNGLGLARYRQADLEGAKLAFEAALRGYEQLGDRRSAARVCLELARIYFAGSQSEEVVHWVQPGRAYLGDDDDPPAREIR
jgi:tetratricopeptide (TPR) repeat protein